MGGDFQGLLLLVQAEKVQGWSNYEASGPRVYLSEQNKS